VNRVTVVGGGKEDRRSYIQGGRGGSHVSLGAEKVREDTQKGIAKPYEVMDVMGGNSESLLMPGKLEEAWRREEGGEKKSNPRHQTKSLKGEGGKSLLPRTFNLTWSPVRWALRYHLIEKKKKKRESEYRGRKEGRSAHPHRVYGSSRGTVRDR